MSGPEQTAGSAGIGPRPGRFKAGEVICTLLNRMAINGSVRRRGTIVMGLALLIYFLFFWKKIFFSGLIPADANTLLMSYPDWRLGKNFFSGALPPLWNPFRNLGEPFLADPKTSVLYPLTWLTFLFGWPAYFKIWTAAHTLLAGISAYLLAKKIFRDREAAAAAGLLAAFNGMMIARSSLPIHFASLSWIPLAAYCLISGRTAALALSLAAQWLCGYPPFTLITVTALVLMLPLAEKPREAAARLLKACLLFPCLAAAQILPFLEMVKESSRAMMLEPGAAFAYSIGPAELMKKTFLPLWYGFFPQSSGDPAVVNFYFGIALPVAAGAILLKKREKARVYVLAVLAASLLFCLGGHNPLYRLIPLFRIFRYPANWLALAALFAPLAAAAGSSALGSAAWKRLFAAAVALDMLVYAQFQHKMWVEPAFFTDIPAVLKQCPPGGRIYHSPLLRTDMDKGLGIGTAGDALLLRESAYPSFGTAFGFGELGSYQVLTSRRAREYSARIAAAGPASPLLDYAGIDGILSLKAGTKGKPLPEPAFMPNPDARPLCFLEPAGGAIIMEKKSPGRLRAVIKTPKPATLVLSQAWYPGWRLELDGKRSDPGIFESFFLSASLPAGGHTVEFVYRPFSFVLGLLISAISAAFLLFGRKTRPGRSLTR